MGNIRRAKPRMSRQAGAMEKAKARFLDVLRTGKSPSFAAEKSRLGRATAYTERARDPEFAKAWADAYDEGNDRLEDTCHHRATKLGENQLLMFMLRGRKPEVYARHTVEPAPRQLHVSFGNLNDNMKQIEDLGLPPMLIAGDYEKVEDDK